MHAKQLTLTLFVKVLDFLFVAHYSYALTMDDLEGQYCNRNCVGCNASSPATAELSFSRFHCINTSLMYFLLITNGV